jgi:membrane-associated phospholipid phosphatase
MSGSLMAYSRCRNFQIFLADFYFRTKGFLVSWAIIAPVALIYLLSVDKGLEVIKINAWSKPWMDTPVLLLTRLGEGGFVVAAGVILLIFSFRWSFITLVTLAFTGLFSGLFKHIIFTHHMRPLHFFYYDDFPRFLHDVPLIYFNSFPSGHTMTIFAFCLLIAYILNSNVAGFALFLFALGVGMSRIYLLQHFGADVLLGSLIGIIAAFLGIAMVERVLKPENRPWMKKGLWSLVIQ